MPVSLISASVSPRASLTYMLSHTGCGIIPASPTIINGSPASFPWMAFLFSSPENGKQSGFCGGSLISDLQILTAAHCVVGKTINDIAVILADKNPQEKLNRWDFLYLFKIEVYPSYNQQLEQVFKSQPSGSLSLPPCVGTPVVKKSRK